MKRHNPRTGKKLTPRRRITPEELYGRIEAQGRTIRELARLENIKAPPTPQEYVIKFGSYFPPRPKPAGIPWGKRGLCHWNALNLAESDKSLTYTEGFAVIKRDTGIIQHAWVVDKRGRVIDNTWRVSVLGYYGIPFRREFILEQVRIQDKAYSLWRGVFSCPTVVSITNDCIEWSLK